MDGVSKNPRSFVSVVVVIVVVDDVAVAVAVVLIAHCGKNEILISRAQRRPKR